MSNLARIREHEGSVLVFDWDDVESWEVQTPADVHETEGANGVERTLGQRHLILTVDFKPGKAARWVDA